MSRPVDRSVMWAPTGTAKRGQQMAEVVRRYTVDLQPIRAISQACGWSYGKTHRLLRESGTPMRSPGGAGRVRHALVLASPDPARAALSAVRTTNGAGLGLGEGAR